jgi:hypothetical protein
MGEREAVKAIGLISMSGLSKGREYSLQSMEALGAPFMAM